MDILYSISKVLLYPEVWIFITLSIGCFLSWTTQCPRSIRFILFLTVLLYYGFATRPMVQALVQPLETFYRPPATMPVHQDAIVLFVNDQLKVLPFTERATIVGTRNTHLLVCGLIYIQTGSAQRVILAEGEVFPRQAIGTAALQEWAVLLGYPAKGIITVNKGVATYERAHAIKQLLGSNSRIVLVDEAIHLPRSVAAFQQVGFTVTPVPCDYQNVSTDPWSFSDFVPDAGRLTAMNEAVHEYIGLLTYWLRGLI